MRQPISSSAPESPTTWQVDLRVASMLGLAALAWLVAYTVIQPLANWLTYTLVGLPVGSRLGESVAFFLYDVPKILLLLGGMIFAVTMTRSFFSPEQTRALLGGKREGVGNVLAASLGDTRQAVGPEANIDPGSQQPPHGKLIVRKVGMAAGTMHDRHFAFGQ